MSHKKLVWTVVICLLTIAATLVSILAGLRFAASCADYDVVEASHGQWQHNCTILWLVPNAANTTNVEFRETPSDPHICTKTWRQTVPADFASLLGPTTSCWSVNETACNSAAISLIRDLPWNQQCITLRGVFIAFTILAVFAGTGFMTILICHCFFD